MQFFIKGIKNKSRASERAASLFFFFFLFVFLFQLLLSCVCLTRTNWGHRAWSSRLQVSSWCRVLCQKRTAGVPNGMPLPALPPLRQQRPRVSSPLHSRPASTGGSTFLFSLSLSLSLCIHLIKQNHARHTSWWQFNSDPQPLQLYRYTFPIPYLQRQHQLFTFTCLPWWPEDTNLHNLSAQLLFHNLSLLNGDFHHRARAFLNFNRKTRIKNKR